MFLLCLVAVFVGFNARGPVASAADVLQTNGFSECQEQPVIDFDQVSLRYEKAGQKVAFNISGTSQREERVTASLIVTAYGQTVYERDFDPCDSETRVSELCPVPSGTFSAEGILPIPEEYLDQIPSITFSIPDLIAQSELKLKSASNGDQIACVQIGLSNGKTVAHPAITYAAVGVAAVALVLSPLSAILTAGEAGTSSPSPSFSELLWWFQSISMNGMFSVDYPPVYRTFSERFGFSMGAIPWPGLQRSIDKMRAKTGGNITFDSYEFLSASNNGTSNTKLARRMTYADNLFSRAVNSTKASNSTASSTDDGIRKYFEDLSVPPANAFMTVLLIFLIVAAAIVVGILLFKVILEVWAMWGKIPKSLESFRKSYWAVIARTMTSFIFIVYGTWTLYSIYQLIHGDSWSAKLLAGLTFASFTLVLGFYTWRIITFVRRSTGRGDGSEIYHDKSIWTRYRIFYEDYRTKYWWFFIPLIMYMLAKGLILAIAVGNGIVQAVGHLIIEAVLLVILLWSRPYNTTSGKWINIVIQIVRVISVCCILVFVENFGIAQVIKSTTGIVLASVQACLTAILALLIGINAIITCIRQNPHRRRRKEAEKRRTLSTSLPLHYTGSYQDVPTRDAERGSLVAEKKPTIVSETRPDYQQPFLSPAERYRG